MQMTKDEALEFFAEFYGGVHHVPTTRRSHGKPALKPYGEGWSVADYRCLATYDLSDLTRLVFLAHERCVRVEIESVNMQMMRICIHKRDSEKGEKDQQWAWHPTLEQAVAVWRRRHPIAEGDEIAAEEPATAVVDDDKPLRRYSYGGGHRCTGPKVKGNPPSTGSVVQCPAEPRKEVKDFALQMERRLKENDHKGGWERMDFPELISRLKDEVIELEDAYIDKLQRTGESIGFNVGEAVECDEAIVKECADVANFAMMIADQHQWAKKAKK